ncbi:hypothetical protein D3OALGA1CA_1847 [Olavius algarvensis associated proteobacterium Delta 3]|nr:hypothetical protein D3OALGA1CA_1847 [Olavius algarvensis associated proteobacterium Delta 3]CAB5135704.1 hypothetical protein D3OALGB2SA_3916 [Olavius algarvensis associated proteobacterium Delta 3]
MLKADIIMLRKSTSKKPDNDMISRSESQSGSKQDGRLYRRYRFRTRYRFR